MRLSNLVALLAAAAAAYGADLSRPARADTNAPLNYTVSWLGNSFSGASNKWVQNFFIQRARATRRHRQYLEPLGRRRQKVRGLSADLVGWTNLGAPVQADGSVLTVIDSVPGAPASRFYRIALTAF